MHQKRIGVHTTSSSAPPRWQAAMQERGGRVLHTIARGGWIVFGLFGALLMFIVTLLFIVFDEDDDVSPLEKFLGGMIVFIPIGVIIFGILGIGVQAATRAWLRSAQPVTSAAEEKAQALADQVGEAGVRPGSRWEGHYARCVRSVTGFHEIVHALTDGAAKSWLAEMGQTLDAELAEALRLARLGNSLEEGSDPRTGLSSVALQADAQLRAAATSFEQTTARAGEIALDLRADSDFARVQAQLDVLAEQTPQLRVADSR